MFWHNFKYILKILLRSKVLVFWTLAFPLILAILFQMAFSNLENSERLAVFDIAVVGEDEVYSKALQSMSQDGTEEQLFHLENTDLDTAKAKLADDEIVGIVNLETAEPEVIIKENGINQTILSSVVENIGQQKALITEVLQTKPEKLAEILQTDYIVNLEDQSPEKLSYMMVEFYTLIAMACLYGGILSMTAVSLGLANLSESGKRIATSPARKGVIILSSLLAGYVIQIIGLVLLFALLILGLKVDFGGHAGLVILLSVVGSLTGLAVGLLIAVMVKAGEGAKIGVLLAVTMTGCFFAGMMGVAMKNLIDQNVPLLNLVNPAALITDGLYSLYYYTGLERFWRDLAILGVITVALVGISGLSLRRQKYDRL